MKCILRTKEATSLQIQSHINLDHSQTQNCEHCNKVTSNTGMSKSTRHLRFVTKMAYILITTFNAQHSLMSHSNLSFSSKRDLPKLFSPSDWQTWFLETLWILIEKGIEFVPKRIQKGFVQVHSVPMWHAVYWGSRGNPWLPWWSIGADTSSHVNTNSLRQQGKNGFSKYRLSTNPFNANTYSWSENKRK